VPGFLLLLLLLFAGGARGQPCIKTTPIGNGNDLATAIAIQPDGKILLAGYASNGANDDFALARYNADFSLDLSFGTGGIVTTAVGGGEDRAEAIALQPDGKIIVAGHARIGANNDFALVRYNSNGSLDTSFNGTGKLTTPIGSGNDELEGVAIQTDGKIVVAGFSVNATEDFVIARYNAGGTLDTSFNGTGIVVGPNTTTNDRANEVAIQSDGKIVIAGWAHNGANEDFAAARYNSNGTPDTTFDGDGLVITPIGPQEDMANSLAIQSDGKIVVTGQSWNGTDNQFGTVRYNTSGSLDTTFDTDGRVTTNFAGGQDIAYGLAIQSDGKIVTAGWAWTGTSYDFALVRYQANGSLDTTFDGDGRVTTPIGASDDYIDNMALQPDGKIVAVGYSFNGSNHDFAIARYNTDGSLATCPANCSPLTTTEGAGTITVTGSGSCESRFNKATGGGIDQFFDLAADPAEIYDLAGDDPASSRHRALFVDEIFVNSVPQFYHTTADGAGADLLEATPTRVKVRQSSPFQDGGGNNLAGIKAFGDYSIYAAGRIGLRWSRRTTSPVISDGQELQLIMRDTGVPPLSTWVGYSQGGILSPFGPFDSDFILVKNDQPQVQTDFLQILYQDWAPTNRTGSNPVAGFRQTFWQDTNVGVPVTDEDVNSVIYFKPTNFVDHLDPAVTGRRDDYRSPAPLSITIGGPWIHASENTAPGDDFNESEAAYVAQFDMAVGLTFDIDGALPNRRYQPFFKIRQWRSLADPSVTLEGTPLTNDLDFRADVKPFARAHRANLLSWQCTLQDAASCTPPNLDVGGSGGTAGGTIVPARYGAGFRVAGTTDNVTAGTADFNDAQGAVEFWYQPNYDSSSLTPHMLWQNINGSSDYIRFEHTGGQLLLEICVDGTVAAACAGGTIYSVTVPGTAFSWRAQDWVHLRADWINSGATRLRIFVNGALVGSSPTFSALGLGHGPTVFGSCSASCAAGGAARHADGVIDEPHIYNGLGAGGNPETVGYAGLTTSSNEALASGTNNATLFTIPVDVARRGEYLYFGSDSQFRGLNVALATKGIGTSPNLQWQFWNGTGWIDLAGFGLTDETNDLTRSGTIYWTGDPFGWAPYSVNGGPDLYYVRAYLASGDYATQAPIESLIKTDILLFQYCGDITAPAQTFIFAVPPTTAVELAGFSARALDGAVELSWQTASELNNLGFHLYRALSAQGTYERITRSAIPGLGSSPAGARYRYLDSGLTNGRTYFYQLEDIETTGRTKRHGPVSASPLAGSTEGPSSSPSGEIAYGNASGNSLQVVKRTRAELLLELRTEGFEAELQQDGSLRLGIAGFEVDSEPGSPALPVKRSWVEVEAGRGVRLGSVRAEQVESFSSLRPSATESSELIASRRGTVRAGRRSQREGAAFRGPGLYPEEPARLVSVGYQGQVKKALLELSPLRWDRTRRELVLARRLRVRLVFSGREETTHQENEGHRKPAAAVRLVAREKGLYGVSFAELLGGRAVGAESLRLSRQGEPVAFHIEPDNRAFGPGSTLYFLSEGASLNPYGGEAVYELSLSAGGLPMGRASASPSGAAVDFYWQLVEREENHYYQAALLEAEDLWLWDLLLAPVEKSYPFELAALAEATEASRLRLWLQGASDFAASPDHHLRVRVNGLPIAEASFEGKKPLHLDAEIPPGVLHEGQNLLSLENVGDTAASYSMVMLERFAVDYPRRLVAEGGTLSGGFSQSGVAEIAGVSSGALLFDLTEQPVRWLSGAQPAAHGLQVRVEAGHRYLVVSSQTVKKPEIQTPLPGRLKNEHNRGDYLMLGPRQLLEVASPLRELRRRQGLTARAVALEEIYSEFGHGESRPEAIREFLSYAYHHWRKPAPRYVVLLGDASYDFKDYLGTGVKNQVPSLTVKTSYLWTASDPAYAAVNGEDILPDLAVGRLPAASADELRVMVEKLLAFEASDSLASGKAVLVADNPDAAGDFERDSEEIATGLFASRSPKRIYLGQLGVEPTRQAILQAFDAGAAVVSYAGHGGIHLWAQENIFSTAEVARLAPQSAQPLVLTLNCLNGYFHFPYFNALSEELLKAEGKGAIAAFSPSGLSLNEPAHLFHKALLGEILSGKHDRLGDAVLAAQAAYAETGAFPELLSIYHLFGDPALKLR